MEKQQAAFERALKDKLMQKCAAGRDEEAYFYRSLKHFDTNNDGKLALTEWLKAIEMMGVVLGSREGLTTLFQQYYSSKDGLLSCKEFSNRFFPPTVSYLLSPITHRQKMEDSSTTPHEYDEGSLNVESILAKLRLRLRLVGVRSIVQVFQALRVRSMP
jgi:hypothetical protein